MRTSGSANKCAFTQRYACPQTVKHCHVKCQFLYIAHLLYNSCMRCCQFSHSTNFALSQTGVVLSSNFFPLPSMFVEHAARIYERSVITCVKFAACLKFNTSPLSALKPLTAAATAITVMP